VQVIFDTDEWPLFQQTAFCKNPSDGLSSGNQDGVRPSGKNQNKRQKHRTLIADLIGDRKHNASQNKVHQCTGIAIRELKEGNYQPHKASHCYYVKKCRHFSVNTNLCGIDFSRKR
jgi:hypothetical protein